MEQKRSFLHLAAQHVTWQQPGIDDSEKRVQSSFGGFDEHLIKGWKQGKSLYALYLVYVQNKLFW